MTSSRRRGSVGPALVVLFAAWPWAAVPGVAQENPDESVSPVLAVREGSGDSIVRPVSPLGALGRSIIVPGWGQASVDQPVRGAFYFALEAGSLFMVFKTQAKLNAARRGLPVDTALVRSRTQQREDWIAIAAFSALLSGVDAWVSAHLWDFEGEVIPPEDGSVGIALRYRIPVGAP